MNKIFTTIAIIVLLICIILIFKNYSPYETNIFPPCPFYSFTGLKCPGCGSQRAIHYLLNFNIIEAIKENVLLVISLPYIILYFIISNLIISKDKRAKWHSIFFGTKAIRIIIVVIISHFVVRNINWGYF